MIQIFAVLAALISSTVVQAEVLNYRQVQRMFERGREPRWTQSMFVGRCFRAQNPDVPVAGLLALEGASHNPKILLLIGPGEGDSANMYDLGDPYIMEYAIEMLRRIRPHTSSALPFDGSLVGWDGRHRVELREGTLSYLVRWNDEFTRQTTLCRFSKEDNEQIRN